MFVVGFVGTNDRLSLPVEVGGNLSYVRTYNELRCYETMSVNSDEKCKAKSAESTEDFFQLKRR